MMETSKKSPKYSPKQLQNLYYSSRSEANLRSIASFKRYLAEEKNYTISYNNLRKILKDSEIYSKFVSNNRKKSYRRIYPEGSFLQGKKNVNNDLVKQRYEIISSCGQR